MSNVVKIVPAILTNSTDELLAQLRIARQLTDRVQIDIIDGNYVDNKTIQPNDISKPVDAKIDLHLMVEDVAAYISQCISLNPYTIIFQFDAIKLQKNILAAIEQIQNAGFRAGLALNPDITIEQVSKFIPKIDHILIMGYKAGFMGQKFQRAVLEKVALVRAIRPDIEVGIDGGVNHSTIKAIAGANFDVVNVNTYLFFNPETDPLSVYSELLGVFS
jgi:ribulose-phosphate 3-epimerase